MLFVGLTCSRKLAFLVKIEKTFDAIFFLVNDNLSKSLKYEMSDDANFEFCHFRKCDFNLFVGNNLQAAAKLTERIIVIF
jgi:hypothetical protein